MFKGHLRAIRESFWFLPAIYNLAALVIATVLVMVDYQLASESSVLGIAPLSLSRTTDMLTSLGGAILTMTTISFSAILVVLTTYSAQFSPRVLQNFIANRSTQHVLALFSSGFTFCIFALLIVSEEKTYQLLATPIGAVAWSLAGIGAFIFLLHHTTSWLRVNNLIGFVAEEAGQIIRHIQKRDLNQVDFDADDSRWQAPGRTIVSPISGYVVLIEFEALVEQASADDLLVRMDTTIGRFVLEGMPLMTLIGAGVDGAALRNYAQSVSLDIEPKGWQDIGFAIRKVTEIGLRAISPSINDPYTAATSIHHIAALLVKLSGFVKTQRGFGDSDGELRLLSWELTFEDYLLGGFQELRRYGSQDNTTLVEILTALGWVARMGDERWHELLWEFGADTYRLACCSSNLLGAEQQRLDRPIKELADAVSKPQALKALLENPSLNTGVKCS